MDVTAAGAPSGRLDAPGLAAAIYCAALEAVRADRLTLAAVRREGDRLLAGDLVLPLSRFRGIYVVGAGKAAGGMVAGIEERLADRIDAGVAVTKEGHSGPSRVVKMLEAGHPVPDERSVEAGRAIVELVTKAGPDDLVLVLLSGGASALMELPREGVSLGDLRATTDLLLRSGATIEEVNTIRPCLSQIKAGGLARAAAPAHIVCLVLSDVLGNPLDVIGSGPCFDTPLRPGEARRVLQARGLWDQVPGPVRTAVETAGRESSPWISAPADHVVIGDIWTALRACDQAAKGAGLHPLVLSGWMQGEAREVGQVLAGMCRDLPKLRDDSGADCILLGGETTVTVRGSGKGGRSQEMACVASRVLAGVKDVAFLAAGTDGTDGPTDAAGGLVDGATMARAEAAGFRVADALRSSDSYAYLESAGALIRTGPTCSNVGDLVVMVSPASEEA